MFRPRNHVNHTGRFVAGVLMMMVLVSGLSWSSHASAQPMCPIDQIWDEETEDCIALAPTETTTPSPTTEIEGDVSDNETVTETPTEENIPEDVNDAESPEMDDATPDDEATDTSGDQFSIFGWDPFGFEGSLQMGGWTSIVVTGL